MPPQSRVGRGRAKKSESASRSSTKKLVYKLKRRGLSNETAEDPPSSDSLRGEEESSNAGAPSEDTASFALMERQLRAGLAAQIPSSVEQRAELERSLPPESQVSTTRIVQVPDLSRSSVHVKSSKKRARTRMPVQPGNLWVAQTEWDFAEDILERVPFVRELWMMMASFGDPREEIKCTCAARGKRNCACLEAVAAIEPFVRKFGARLVSICRQWSSREYFTAKHLRMAMPGEMREYMAWREAHSRRGTKNVDEKRAGIALDEIDADDDYDVDADEEAGPEGLEFDKEDRDATWDQEEEDVAARMEQRKMFLDERTSDMDDDTYVQTFFEYRKAFFLQSRGKSKRASLAGSRPFFARYIGLYGRREERDRKLLEALAYMLYDYVGLVVETAIRARNAGRLSALNQGEILSEKEITAAAAWLLPLPDRKQRECVRAVRTANPDGLATKPLTQFPVGLEYRGNPRNWPCNTIDKGRVLVEGGEMIDASDARLAEEAMAILESDFADID